MHNVTQVGLYIICVRAFMYIDNEINAFVYISNEVKCYVKQHQICLCVYVYNVAAYSCIHLNFINYFIGIVIESPVWSGDLQNIFENRSLMLYNDTENSTEIGIESRIKVISTTSVIQASSASKKYDVVNIE